MPSGARGQLKDLKELLRSVGYDFPAHLPPEDEERLKRIFADFLTGFSVMVDKGPVVTVFGSSRITHDKPEYKLGEELGGALVKLGFAVLTGGGPGLMEAVNKGAHLAKGRSIGINIAVPEEQQQNVYASPSITINHFFVRKVLLLKYSSAYIFLPGGFGTLDEFFETVTLIQTRKISPFPVILMRKDHWKGLMHWINGHLKKEGLISDEDTGFLYFADTVAEAMDIIRARVKNGTLQVKTGK